MRPGEIQERDRQANGLSPSSGRRCCLPGTQGSQPPHPKLAPSAGQVRPMLTNGSLDRPDNGQLDRPPLRPTSKERAPRASTQPTVPRWKVLARPRLTQRRSTQQATWENKQGHNHGASTMQVHPQATDIARPGVARTPQAQEGAMVAKKGQGRQVGGRETKKRGPKPQRSPKGEDWLQTHSPITLTPPPTETPHLLSECPS